MSLQTPKLAIPIACAMAVAYLLGTSHPLRVDGFCSSIYWTIRSWLWNYPVPRHYRGWYGSHKPEDFWEDRSRAVRVWTFLRPFFTSHGYDLYTFKNPDNISEDLFPSTASVASPGEATFPYGRCLFKDTMSTGFMFHSLRVWPARDRHGRDVVIKAISGPTPTTELQTLRLLQSDILRNDPRNHTIPVLDFLDFAGHVFVVMPRWDAACDADFVKVGELVRYGQAFFEVVAFLHENGIGHGDIDLQNMAMDLILSDSPPLAGVRGPERRYALIDFEIAKLVDVNQPSTIPAIFKRDVNMLARAAEIYLRCIQDILPELAPLFDAMQDVDGPTQPTAAAALAKYEEICNSLSGEDLECIVEATRWRNGKTTYRTGPPVYYQ